MGRLLPRSDASAAAPARHPRAVTADRGYGGAKVEAALQDLGVTHIVLPCKGRPSKTCQTIEHQRSFRRLVKWRTGSEARISHLKHPWAMDPTLTDGTDGTHAWCGWAILSHNLQTIDDSAHDRRRQHRTKSDSAETPIHPPGDYFSGK